MLPELKALPAGWIIKSDKDWRIYYQNPDNQTAYDHPTLGQLPKPWIIRCCMEADGKRAPRYFHKDTKRFTKKDPRIDKRVLHNQNNSNKGSMLETTMRVHKMEKGVQLEDLQRQEISKVNFRNTFDILKVLDYPGKDATGGMNGGVFVVKRKTNNHQSA